MENLDIERTIWVEAPRERVWSAITEPEQFSQWFGGQIRFERLAVGEAMTFFEERYPGTIAAVEPPERFSFYWLAEANHSARTLVTFLLKTVDHGTQITVTEKGFEALPEELRQSRFDSNNEGWRIQLQNIAQYLRRGH